MASFMPARARIVLIAAAVGVAAASVAQDRSDEVRSWQAAWQARQAHEAERREAERIRRDYERRRAIAHARMRSKPDTMRASRPDAAPDAMCPVVADPEARREFQRELRQRRGEAFRRATGLPLRTGLSVHPVPKRTETRALATGSLAMSASSHPSPAAVFVAASSSSAAQSGHMVPLFPSASDALGRQGFARVINHGDEAGEATINAYDDQGTSHGPLTLTLDAGGTVHFNSADLENGNAGKGLSGSTGPGIGDWRLELDSGLDIEVLSYIRTGDGFLTAMHDTAPEGGDGHRVAIFNPGSNTNQESLLRLVNRGDADAAVTITGTDDKGSSPGDGATAVLPAHSSVTYTAAELESGDAEGLTGSIGDGSGKWRLTVRSEQDIVAMSLLSSPTGHLTNLSTAPDNETAGTHSVPLFPSASDENGHQGFLRVVNHADESGEVTIGAFDDTDREYDTLTLAIGANEAKHFNSDDLELGNAGKGLVGSTGAGGGDWRLELTSVLDIEVLAYIRTTDGFLTAIHDPVPRSAKRHRVAVFNPGSNANQLSVLRLVNAGRESASATVTGVDDRGESPGDGVAVTVPAGGSAPYTAAELESGNAEGLDGSLGDGSGKWRLTVNADRPIVAMSLLSSPTGHLTNLSTAPQRGAGPVESADEAFEALISPIVQSKCVNCHYEGNTTGNMPVFVRDADADHLSKNLNEFEDYLEDVEDGASRILNKIQGAEGHGGGIQVAANTLEFAGFEQFLELLGAEVEGFFAVDLFEGVTLESKRRTLWRAAIMFAGRIPTEEEYAEVEDGTEDDLRMAIWRLMKGSGFHEFLLRGANDRLLTDRDDIQGVGVIDPIFAYFVAYNNLNHERLVAEDPNYDQWQREVDHGIRRAPLELIAHVAENELDYRDILRADYIMANPMAAEAYGAPIDAFDDPGDPLEFAPSRIESYYRTDGSKEWEYSLDLGTHVSEPGDLWTDYPHAGILNTTVFLKRYPTTATNRNRARSRWTYYHFLGYDIEKSASRTMDPEVLGDTNNPTMHNPACTACHERMDPVAGAFQNYDDIGYYRSSYEGLDSLDETYKYGDALGAFELPGAAPEGGDPTISVTASPKADEGLYLTIPEAHWGNVALDRMDVVAVEDGSVVQSIEFEDPTSGHTALVDECGHASGDHWLLFCPTYVPLSVQAGATYELEVHAWAVDEANGTTSLAMSTTLYRKGDHWYRDVRSPGFVREPEFVAVPVPEEEQHASLRWLAERIVEDERFAKAVVKFWWPAIMGSEVAEQPQVADDVGYDAQKLVAGAHAAEVERLAGGFRRGFGWSGERPYDLKDLLVEMAMSDWFRAAATSEIDPTRRAALRHAGAKRLLTPEELSLKTETITGFVWGRRRTTYPGWSAVEPEDWTSEELYGLLYGGIDSGGVAERARDLTPVMGGVAKRHASAVACPVVMKDLFLLEDGDRRLFGGVDRDLSPAYEFGAVLDVVAESEEDSEIVSVTGSLSAGTATAVLWLNNELRDADGTHVRNLYLDRIALLDAEGVEVDSEELEDVDHHCVWDVGSAIVFWDECHLPVPLDVPASGSYEIAVTTWAEHEGDNDEPAKLEIVMEGDPRKAAGSEPVREKLAELHEKLLGIPVEPDSTEVEATLDLFVRLWEDGRESRQRGFNMNLCEWNEDHYYMEGILEGAWQEPEEGAEWDWDVHGWNNERLGPYFDSIDWSDRHHIARTWVAMLAYFLTDYRYLYL